MTTSLFDRNMLPEIKIIEQPASRGTRYRYECEMRSQSTIQGVSGPGHYPTIQVLHYIGDLTLIVCCVTNDPPYRPHPHKLVNGNLEHRHGVCYFRLSDYKGEPIPFKNFSIQCVARKLIKQALSDREQERIDPFKTGFEHKNKPDDIDLNCVRLCIQVILESPVNPIMLNPIVTNSIYDRRTVCDLKICWLSHKAAPISGGMEMCILCDKVRKADVEVRFFHEKSNWEAKAVLISPKILKQVAIVFQVPPFTVDNSNLQDIQEPVNVKIQLIRKSNGETSQPVNFQFLPITNGNLELAEGFTSSKRKRNDCYENESDEIYRKIQAEVAAERTKASSVERDLQESKTDENDKVEPWELPSVNEFLSSQSKSSVLPLVNKNKSRLNRKLSVEESNSVQSHDTVQTTQTNIIKNHENNNSTGILNSDTWVEVLLKSLDPKGAVAFPNSPILASEIAKELQTDSMSSNLSMSDYNEINVKKNSAFNANAQRNTSHVNHKDSGSELTYEFLYNNIPISDLMKDININIEDPSLNINDVLMVPENNCNSAIETIKEFRMD